MKNPILVVMAAGMGSRYGGLKQIDPVDEQGHIIMDFSIYAAVKAGFKKVVFIIKEENEKDFKAAIGDRLSKVIDVSYVYQKLENIPEGFTVPEGRIKPFGTGHAILSCINEVDAPFAVINADDYYGKEAFVKLHGFLEKYTPEKANEFCMAGFILKNTLSENGAVTRGVCKVNEEGYLTGVDETSNIVKTSEGAGVANEGTLFLIDAESYVSMYMWGLTPDFLDVLENGFKEFFEKEVPSNPQKAEYLIPIFIGELLEQGKMSVKVLKTNDTWYGMTYHEDVAAVKDSFKKMLENGVYKADLFSDL